MVILGISAFYHDSAAAVVRDGQIVAAVQEERFTRHKNDAGFPRHSIDYCMREAGLRRPSDFDIVCFYESSPLKFERILQTFLECSPRGYENFQKTIPIWLKRRLFTDRVLRESLQFDGTLLWCGHHESHASSAFYPSPFETATIVTLDGVGEWTTTAWGSGQGNRLGLSQELAFPHSIGLLYSAFTSLLGFAVNRDEYKVMGLAPFGEPTYVRTILDNLVDLKDDGSIRLNLDYFDYLAGETMTTPRFEELLGIEQRRPGQRLQQQHMDIAASIQAVIELTVCRVVGHAVGQTGNRRLCLAGGVALNCVANGRLMRDGLCDNLWIQPAAGDAGGALGVALYAYHQAMGRIRSVDGCHDSQMASLLGPQYSADDIRRFLAANNYPHTEFASELDLYEHVAGLLDEGRVVGWFQGRMEFGPRALGARSIIGDPRSPHLQSLLNLKIKGRESFRPFAPAVLREDVSSYFGFDQDSDYMLLVAPVSERHRRRPDAAEERLRGFDRLRICHSDVPAVTHVDYSARIQTVDRRKNPTLHGLISTFKRRTGCPMILNTSFNLRDEPIVESPRDAYQCFHRTDMDALVLGRAVVHRDARPSIGSFRTELRSDEEVGDFYTIYVLGGSTAVGYPYAPEIDVGKLVCQFYSGRIDGKPVRVVNLGGLAEPVAMAAERVKQVSSRASLILLYAGHNEFLLGYPYWWGDRWEYVLGTPPRWVQTRGCSARRRRKILGAFESSLRAIVRHAQAIGVPIILSTAASNQQDWPPNASGIRHVGHRARVSRGLKRAARCVASGDRGGAKAAIADVLDREPEVAHAHWLLGHCLIGEGRCDEARHHFQKAVDADVRPTRACSAENDLVLAVAREMGVPVVRFERLLEERGRAPALGYELFDDNCHPNLEGLATLAEGFCEAMARCLNVRGRYRRLTTPDIERAFAIDVERRARVLATRAFYIFGSTFVSGNPVVGPATDEIASIRRQLRALCGDGLAGLAVTALALAIAGDTDGFLRAAKKLRASLEPEPHRFSEWLGTDLVQQTFVRRGWKPSLTGLGIRPAGFFRRMLIVLAKPAAGARSAMSRAAVWCSFFGVIVPAGVVARGLKSTGVFRVVDRAAASYWQPYRHDVATIERRPKSRALRHFATIGFLLRRRRFVVAIVCAILMSMAFVTVARGDLVFRFIYPLF